MEIVKGNYNPEKKTAVIVILNDYNKKTAKSIRNLYLERDDSYLLMTYVYNGNFYIDSLYIGAFKMPCHLCQISNIETNIRNLSSDSLTYQHILDTIYSEFEDISTSYPLDKSQILNIATMLTNNINKLITLKDDPVVFQEELSYSTMMNLKSKEVVVDTPIHWDLCDCYE